MKRVLPIFCSLAFAFPVAAQEAGPIHIAGSSIPKIFDRQDPGPYDRIYQLVTVGSSHPLILKMLPSRRAFVALKTHSADCLFISSDRDAFFHEMGLDASGLIYSDPIQTIAAKLYSRHDQPVINDLKQVEGKTIAADITIGEPEYLNERNFGGKVRILPVATLRQGLSLLDQDRVVAVLGFDLDMRVYKATAPGKFNYHADPAFSISNENDTFTCWRNEATETFIQEVNQKLGGLRASGELERLLHSSQ